MSERLWWGEGLQWWWLRLDLLPTRRSVSTCIMSSSPSAISTSTVSAWRKWIAWHGITLFKSIFVPQSSKVSSLTDCSVCVWVSLCLFVPDSHFLHSSLILNTQQGSEKGWEFPDCHFPESEFKAGLVSYKMYMCVRKILFPWPLSFVLIANSTLASQPPWKIDALCVCMGVCVRRVCV